MKTSGGDIIKRKSICISLLTICIAISGLYFSEAMNSQNFSNKGGNGVFESEQAIISNDMSAEPNVKAQFETEKGGSISTDVKCSCSLHRDNALHAKSWLNYCPKCHRSGTLTFEKTRDCPEGMIRCTHCDADFCPVHGKEHIGRGAAYLKPA
ncbi:MAG TPA: hypothetical protein VK426_06900 [Methanobacterium sp.]|nr:hypothetical protein [Methanobacterium sp.]